MTPIDLATAINDCDDVRIDRDLLEFISRNLCPNDAQIAQMDALKAEHPTVEWELPEKYMYALRQLKACGPRLECWLFVRTYVEKYEKCMTGYTALSVIFLHLKESQALRKLIGLILCAGNYLNAATKRGQAEAFQMETLSLLATVKEAVSGKTLSHWVMEKFLQDPYFCKNEKGEVGHLSLFIREMKLCPQSENLRGAGGLWVQHVLVVCRSLALLCEWSWMQFVSDNSATSSSLLWCAHA